MHQFSWKNFINFRSFWNRKFEFFDEFLENWILLLLNSFQILVLALIIILLRNRGYWKVRQNQISCTPNSSRPSTAPSKDPFDSTIDWSSTVQDTNSIRIVQSTRPHSSRPSSAFIARSALRTRSHLADYDSVRDLTQSENRHLHDTQNTRFGERSATASSRRSSGNILLINIYNI